MEPQDRRIPRDPAARVRRALCAVSLAPLLLGLALPVASTAGTLAAHGQHGGEDHSFEDHAGEDLTGIDLGGADLTATDLTGTTLRDASLRDAVLAGADLTGANLTGADATSADLTGAVLDGTLLIGVRLEGADLGGASLVDAQVWFTDATDASFENAQLDGAVFLFTDVTGADFSGASLLGANLGATLDASSADFTGAYYDAETVLPWRLDTTGMIEVLGPCPDDPEAMLLDVDGDGAGDTCDAVPLPEPGGTGLLAAGAALLRRLDRRRRSAGR